LWRRGGKTQPGRVFVKKKITLPVGHGVKQRRPEREGIIGTCTEITKNTKKNKSRGSRGLRKILLGGEKKCSEGKKGMHLVG